MPPSSKWGSTDLKPSSNQEHKEVEKSIFEKLLSLGDATGSNGKPLTANEIHKLDKAWQPFNSRSFANSVKRCRKMIDEGKTSYDATNEEKVSAPTKENPHTSVANEDPEETSAAAAVASDTDMLDLDSTESFFMSNEGSVQLPFQAHLLTHIPEDETGRKKYVHIIIHLLSGTHHKDGYSVGSEPKGTSLFLVHQKGDLQNVFWGDPGRVIVRDPVAIEKMALNCAQQTSGFTDITEQVQIINFPFALRRLLKPRPFWVTVHDGPSGKFLGLYVKAEVDWNDNVAAASGEDYAEILSPKQNDSSFYSSASRFAPETKPSASHSSTKTSAAPESVGDNLSLEDYSALIGLLTKMNLPPVDGKIHVDSNMTNVQHVKPTPSKYAKPQVGAANINLSRTRLDFDTIKNGATSLLGKVAKSASKTASTADCTVGFDDDDDLSEDAEELYSEYD